MEQIHRLCQMQQQQHAGEQQQLATNAHDAANSVMPFEALSISRPQPAVGGATVISSNSNVDRSIANVADDSDIFLTPCLGPGSSDRTKCSDRSHGFTIEFDEFERETPKLRSAITSAAGEQMRRSAGILVREATPRCAGFDRSRRVT